MYREFIPIPYELFPSSKEIIDGTNCLAFVLGIFEPKLGKEEYNLNADIPIEDAFLKQVKRLGFDPMRFKKISTEDEVRTNGYIIRVYDFATVELSDGTITKDFHLIRREPDGQWVHKPGYNNSPRKVSVWDWWMILRIFGNKFISFAIDV